MGLIYQTPTEADFERITELDGRAFHTPFTPEAAQFALQSLDLSRFVVARDDEKIVAVGGAYELELTLPGLARLPMSGVTWMGVAVTHRRRGILSRMMEWLDEQAATADEPLLGLRASEGSIYGRFGYGVVNQARSTKIDRRSAKFRQDRQPRNVELQNPRDAVPLIAAIWDRYRRAQHGELSRSEANVRRRMVEVGPAATAAVHPDGYVVWKATLDWGDGLPASPLEVIEFCAMTAEAHEELWRTVLSVDLVGEVSAYLAIPEEDRLSHLLENPRAVQTTALHDGLWLKVTDPLRAFGARSFRVDDRFVLETSRGTLAVTADRTVQTDAAPDLVLDDQALGPLLFGSVSASHLTAVGLCRAADAGCLGRADAFFGFDPKPVTRLEF